MTMEKSWETLLSQLQLVKSRLGKTKEVCAYAEAFSECVRRFKFYDDDELKSKQSLAHYTTWERALAILEVKSDPVLRMYNYEGSNDPQEGMFRRNSWKGIEEASQWLDEFLPEHEVVLVRKGESTGRIYGCSFSSEEPKSEEDETKERERVEDNLTYWRLYGNDGEGCSFGVRGSMDGVYRVRYLEEGGQNIDNNDEIIDKEVARHMKVLLEIGEVVVPKMPSQHPNGQQPSPRARVVTGLRQLLSGYNHLAKSSYFKDEKEWRRINVAPLDSAVCFDVDKTLVKRYVKGPKLEDFMVSGSSITIGPQVSNPGASRAYIECLVRKHGMKITQVRISKPVYRSGV